MVMTPRSRCGGPTQWRSTSVHSATLDDLREAVATLEDTARTARRVLGGAHPLTGNIGEYLREVHGILRARKETQPAENLAEEVD